MCAEEETESAKAQRCEEAGHPDGIMNELV